jgi:hypothetical protein
MNVVEHSPPPERRRTTARALNWRSLAIAALLLGCAALQSYRAADLARRGAETISAHGESRWRLWAYRRTDLAGLREMAAQLGDGEEVALMVPPRLTHEWWRVMALYYFPRQRVVGVYDIDARRAPRPNARRVVVHRFGGFHIAGQRAVPPK